MSGILFISLFVCMVFELLFIKTFSLQKLLEARKLNPHKVFQLNMEPEIEKCKLVKRKEEYKWFNTYIATLLADISERWTPLLDVLFVDEEKQNSQGFYS